MAETSVSHAHETHGHDDGASLWEGGGESPFKASYGKIMMWYFLVSDAFTFAGFLIAYGTLRFSMPTWPEPDFVFASFPFVHAHWPLVFVTFMTFVLIFSSVTMVRAVQEGHRENQRGVVFWMFLTILGGATFLGCQAYEWTTLIKGENVSVTRNPFGRYMADGVLVDKSGKEIMENGSPITVKKDDSYWKRSIFATPMVHMQARRSKSNRGQKPLAHSSSSSRAFTVFTYFQEYCSYSSL
jgi:cytochrome c oxidase subunit III